MSENEEKDRHTVVPEPTVIVLSQQSEHRPPYPADPPDDSNKRAKKPSIPSTATTAADLKEASTAQHTGGGKQESSERTENTALSKKNLNQASAMLSSPSHLPEITKPFEDIALATVESEPVLKVIPSEPIALELKPAGERSRGSLRSRKSAGEESEEEDAVPTREPAAISDWRTDNVIKKKLISWSDPEYLDVQLRESCSFDPYLGCGRAHARAKSCGIAWRIPGTSLTELPAPSNSGINFVISKGPSIQFNRHFTIPPSDDEDKMMPTTQSHEEISPYCATLLREKLDTMFNKMKHFFKR